MNIAVIPAGTRDQASARIRAFGLQRALLSLGHGTTIGLTSQPDVLLLQNHVTWEMLDVARAVKAGGTTVVYDVDQIGDALLRSMSLRGLYDVLQLADVVTTDTNEHRRQLRDLYGVRSAEVVQDAIDYEPFGPMPATPHEAAPLRILWFGGGGDMLVQPFLSTLTEMPDVEVVVCADQPDVRPQFGSSGAPEVVRWRRDTFPDLLRSCHLTCLVDDARADAGGKGHNRMITSITWGVPALVLNTPDHHHTAAEIGVSDAVFDDAAGLRAAVARFRSADARASYLAHAQPAVWRAHSPVAVATKFLDVVTHRRRGRTPAPKPTDDARDTTKRHVRAQRRAMFELWRIRHSTEPAAVAVELGRELVDRTLRPLRNGSRPAQTTKAAPRVTPAPRYRRLWVNSEGKAYRKAVYERQRAGGTQPLMTNPTFDTIRDALRAHAARRVLEVGCGWGRLLEQLTEEFDVQGCDVSDEMLAWCRSDLKVFHCDIASDDSAPFTAMRGGWDVLFMRGVMVAFEEPRLLASVMNNMLALRPRKILVWDWPEVCDRMRQVSNHPSFEYHVMRHATE
jgi:hypothetical protein